MIGSGAAGSVFAAYLKKGGADMYLVDKYRAHMDKIKSSGLRFLSPAGAELIKGFHTAESAEELPIMDIIILMVKATQTEGIMQSLVSAMDENTVLVSLQNGLGNENLLAKYLPKSRIICGFGTIGTELPEPGVCVSKPESGVIMNFGPAESSELNDRAGKYLESCFIKGGCEARYVENIKPLIWKKAISNSGYNTLSALTALNVGNLLKDQKGRELIKKIWEEGCAVAEADGAGDLRAEMENELPRLMEGFESYYPSMAQDMLMHERKTEISVLNGAIADYGRKYQIPTPYNSLLTELVSCIENNYHLRFKKV